MSALLTGNIQTYHITCYNYLTVYFHAFLSKLKRLFNFSTMSEFTDVNQLSLDDLEWSPASFKVDDFLSRFSLPQIVKVNEGYYGDDEESSFGADQILTLHLVKSTEKVYGHDYRGKEVNIPLNCPSKVELRPSNLKDVYESVDELCTVFPNYVRISQGYYSVSRDEELLNVGDKLRLKSIDKSRKGNELLICVNQNGARVELPRDCVAGFQPLTDGKEYYVAEVAKQFTLPLYIQFVDPPIVGAKQHRPTNEAVFNSSLGSIYLEKKYHENLVIASTISHEGRRSVVTFPRDMDIRISASEDMLRNSPKYAQVCQVINDGVDLASLRHIDAFNAFKPRHSVKEYSYKELVSYAVVNLSDVNEDETAQGDLPLNPENKTKNVEESRAEVKLPENKQRSPEVEEQSQEMAGIKPELNDPPLDVGQAVNSEIKMAKEDDIVQNGLRRDSHGQNVEVIRSSSTGKSSRDSHGHNVEVIRCSSTGKSSPGKAPRKPFRQQNNPKNTKKDEGFHPSQADVPFQATIPDTIAVAQTKQPTPQHPSQSIQHISSDQRSASPVESTAHATTKKAPDMSACSVKQVSDILRELGMAKYVVKFEAEMIDGEMLSCLTDDILVGDFGMTRLHCMKLKKYLEGWRPKV